MPRSEAQKRAEKKYKEKTYKSFTINAKIDEYEKINQYCTDHNISRSKLLLNAVLYVIDHNIKID